MKIISKEVQEALDKIDPNTDWIIDGETKAKLEIVGLKFRLKEIESLLSKLEELADSVKCSTFDVDIPRDIYEEAKELHEGVKIALNICQNGKK